MDALSKTSFVFMCLTICIVAYGAGLGMSLSATADFAVSNANSLRDFAGTFIEAGDLCLGRIPYF